MRVLAVAQFSDLLERQRELVGKGDALLRGEVAGDGAVVTGGELEGLGGQREAGPLGEGAVVGPELL